MISKILLFISRDTFLVVQQTVCKMKTSRKALLNLITTMLILGLPTVWCFGQQFEKKSDKVNVWWSSELKPGSKIWYTNPPPVGAIKYKLSRQKDISLSHDIQQKGIVFNIDPDVRYQSVLGFGLSLEETSIYALRKNKNEAQIRQFIRLLLNPEKGMGISLFRITIGTSDFSDGRSVSDHPKGYYTYQDDPNQPFSIQNDKDLQIIETLRMVIEEAENLSLRNGVKFFASVWSPPSWMKTSGSLIGGTLKEGFEGELAKYFRKFIEAYQDEGIPIHAITIQNEPNFAPKTYPGMLLTPEQEKDIAKALKKEFDQNDGDNKPISAEIWINDHNMNHWKNADRVLRDLKKENKTGVVQAVAFHNYNMAPTSNMSKLHDRHPDVDLHLTEHSEWGVSGMYNIQQYFQHWCRSYSYWVPYTTRDLGEHNQGPYNKLGALSPTLFIEKKDGSPDWYVTPEYYLISQFSRFIRPGAVRIQCNNGNKKQLTSIVFRSIDGSIVQVLVNQTSTRQEFSTVMGESGFSDFIEPKTVGTYVFNPSLK